MTPRSRLVKQAAQLCSYDTVRSILPMTVVTGYPNIPVGEVPLMCISVIALANFAGDGGSVKHML